MVVSVESTLKFKLSQQITSSCGFESRLGHGCLTQFVSSNVICLVYMFVSLYVYIYVYMMMTMFI